MNRRWQRTVATVTLGLMLWCGGEARGQYGPGHGHDDPTPIAGSGFPAFPISPTAPIPPPQGPVPDLPGWMYGAFDDGQNCCSEPPLRHYITIDVLTMQAVFDNDPAFKTNKSIPGIGGPGEVEFERGFNVIPRVNLNFQVTPLWGVRGSWWQMFAQDADRIQFNNTDPTRQVTSEQPLPGFVINSPQTFFFLPLLPSRTLFDIIPQPLPEFPFTNSVAMGFPDVVTFQSQMRMTVVDFEVTRYIEIGDAYGTLNLGVRYAYLSQNYTAARGNDGGTRQTVRYDPFISLDDDAALTVTQDFRVLFYGHNFRGVGPKLGFNLDFPLGDWIGLYSSVSGSVLMGSRREFAAIGGQQNARLSDIDRNIQADLFFTSSIAAQQERDEFTVIPVGEVEAGFAFRLGNNVIQPLFKVGFLGQYWVNAGNATNPNRNLFLYGVNASVGFGF